MNNAKLLMLEKAFACEVDGALNRHLGIMQSRSKVAKELAEEGMLLAVEEVFGTRFQIKVKGYRLSELGRATYCASCNA